MSTSYELSTDTDISALSEEEEPSTRDLPDNWRKLIVDFEKKFEQAKSQRYKFEKQWYLNLAFYGGKQWVNWQNGPYSELSRLVEPPRPPWRVRLTVNKIRPLIRGEIARMTKEDPRFYVVPSSTEEEDVVAARAGERVAEHLVRELKIKKEVRKATFWASVCGNGFIKDWYEPEEYDFDGQKGKIHTEAITPFHLFIPLIEEQELERQPWIIHTLAKEPGWIKNKFGVEIEPDSSSSGGGVEQKFLSAIGVSTNKKQMVSVKEIWIKPNDEFPDGAVCMWAGDQMLYFQDEWPFEHEEYPFSKLDHIPTGRFYSESIITDLIPLQREYNRTRSQIIEAKNRMAKPQLIAPKGSVDADRITTEPGQVIYYTPGFTPPQPLPLQALPSYVLQELDRIQADMDDIAAQHEVSKGMAPPGVEAATAIAFLQEQDDTKIAHSINSIEELSERLGKHLLSHVIQFWKAERTIQVTGVNNMWEVAALSGKNLKGNMNIRVEQGSATPSSRAGKRAFFTELADKGHMGSQDLLKYLGIGETNQLHEDALKDVRHAQRENFEMARGGAPAVNTWDNHIAHIVSHDDFRKTTEFRNLDPLAQQTFEQHANMHHQVISAELGIPLGPTGRLPYEVLLQLTQGGSTAAPQ